MPDDILTIREVANHLKVTERMLYRLVQEGKLRLPGCDAPTRAAAASTR